MTRRLTVATLALVGIVCWGVLNAPVATQGTNAAIPRGPDGKPDFSGVWQALNSAWYDIEDHGGEKGVPPGQSVVVGGEIPYQPWALEQRKKNWAVRNEEDTSVKCYMPGVPRITYAGFPFEFVRHPKKLIQISAWNRVMRDIHLTDTPHPDGPIEWWLGDSRGRWEGDTLVTSVKHFFDNKTWFDKAGNFYSDQAQMEERFSFIDKDHLNYEVTITDPKVYTRPWKMQMPIYRLVEAHPRIMDYFCYGFDDIFEIPAERR